MEIQRRYRIWFGCFLAAGLFLAIQQDASATPGLPGVHDARSVSMAGTGVANTDNASAVFHNPALLEQIETLNITLSVSPFFATGKAPFGGPGGITQRESDTTLVPMFMAAGAYRITDRIVVGLGVFTSGGFGGKYKNVPELGGENLDLTIGAGEISVPISVRIAKGLTLGLAARAAYVFQDIQILVPDENNPGQFLRIDQDLSGFKGPGVLAGLFFERGNIRLGASYRSKLNVGLDGKVTFPQQGPTKFDADSEFALEHEIRAGGAFGLLNNRWLLVGEFVARFHKSANKELVTEVEVAPGVTQEIPFPLDWDNSYGARFGSEFWVTQQLPLRVGYTALNSATPESNASPFLPPPGLLQAAALGGGWKARKFSVDAGVMFFWGSGTVAPTDAPVNGPPGKYDSFSTMVSVSATYHQ